MLWLSERDAEQTVDLRTLISEIRDLFRDFGLGKINNPSTTTISAPELETNFLSFPTYIPNHKIYSAKVLVAGERNTARGLPFVHALVTMFDVETGTPLAVIAGGYTTACRTAAATAIATDVLARKDARVLGMFGTGLEARVHLRALPLVREFDRILVCSSSGGHERAVALADDMSRELGIQVTASSSPAEVAAESDVITTITIAKRPVFPAEAVRPGTHINVIGRFRPNSYEVEPGLLRGGYVVSDDAERLVGRWIDNTAPKVDKEVLDGARSLADLLNGRAPSRSDRNQVTFFIPGGLAFEDAVAAKHVYDRAIAGGVGTRLEAATTTSLQASRAAAK